MPDPIQLTKNDKGELVDAQGNVVVLPKDYKPVINKEQIAHEFVKETYNLEPDQLKHIDDVANQVRTQEKNKLYQEIEDHKNRAKTAQEQMTAIQQQLDTTQGKIKELEKKPPIDPKTQKPDEKTAEELKNLRETINTLQDEKKNLNTAFDNFKADFAEQLRKKDLEAYKQQRIAEAGGLLIPELVNGNSIEEIDLSIEKAKQRYAEIRGKTQAEIQAEADKRKKKSTDLNSQTSITPDGSDQAISLDQMKDMSLEDYAKVRNKLKMKMPA